MGKSGGSAKVYAEQVQNEHHLIKVCSLSQKPLKKRRT